MQRILFIDFACNSVGLAQHVARESNGTLAIYVLSEIADHVTWGYKGIVFIRERWDVEKTVTFAKEEKLNLVVNFNPRLGAAGLLEKLMAEDILCIGSGREFSKLEMDKQYFKNWLTTNNFLTPTVRFQGLYEHILQERHSFSYPLVVKPDSQNGPQVYTCQNEQDLLDYFERTIKIVPYASHSIIFLIEEYIPTCDVVGIQYYLMGGKGYLSDTVQFLFEEKTDANVDGGIFAITPYPLLAYYQEEIQRLIDALAIFGDKAIGHLQFLVGVNGELYVMENNSRPATYSFMNRDDVLVFLDAMASNNVERLKAQFIRLWGINKCAFGIALTHKADRIPVNFDALKQLPNSEYFPFSIIDDNGEKVSSHRKIPSLVLFYGNTYEEAIHCAKATWPKIAECGSFNAINLDIIQHWIK